jgi:hypothetical protein
MVMMVMMVTIVTLATQPVTPLVPLPRSTVILPRLLGVWGGEGVLLYLMTTYHLLGLS